MKINWNVRIKNPMFWAQIAIAVISPILVGLGLQWQDMTSWQALGQALLNAVSNPVIVVAVLGSLWAAITDPTTKGTGDSAQALTYNKPKADDKQVVQAIEGTQKTDIVSSNDYKQAYPTDDKEGN